MIGLTDRCAGVGERQEGADHDDYYCMAVNATKNDAVHNQARLMRNKESSRCATTTTSSCTPPENTFEKRKPDGASSLLVSTRGWFYISQGTNKVDTWHEWFWFQPRRAMWTEAAPMMIKLSSTADRPSKVHLVDARGERPWLLLRVLVLWQNHTIK